MASSINFLRLPQEVRDQIYGFYGVPNSLTICEDKLQQKDPKCKHILSLMNIMNVCWQTRGELHSIFAAHLTVVMADPLAFANHYLQAMPEYRVEAIKNLCLRWTKSTEPCFCFRDGYTDQAHWHAAGSAEAGSHFRDLTKVVKNYPELALSLETIHFDLPWPAKARTSSEQHRSAVCRGVIL